MEQDKPQRKEIVRSNRQRLSQRHVPPKDEGFTASMPRLTEQIRPAKPRSIQNVRKWVKFLRSVLKSKYNQHLQFVFDRLRTLTAAKYGRDHLIGYRLKKLFVHSSVNLKEVALRKILLETLRISKSNASGVILKKNDLYGKSLTTFFRLFDGKMKANLKAVLVKLNTNRKTVSKVNIFYKTSLLRSFGELIKSKLLTGFLKIKGYSNFPKDNRGLVAKYLRNFENKVNHTKNQVFQRIKAYVVAVKRQTQELESQPVEQTSKVEEVAESPAPVQKPADRRLVANVDRSQNQLKNLKVKQEKELNQKRLKLQELEARLAQIQQQNESQSSRIQQSPMAEFHKQQETSFIPKTKVYENIFTNFLFYLKNSEEIITKDKLVESLLVPMSRVDMPIETIRLENEVLEEVLEQYKKLKLKVPTKPPRQPWYENKPYEYLLKENRQLYDILKELVENNDAAINSKNLEQLAKDFEHLQAQLSTQNVQKA